LLLFALLEVRSLIHDSKVSNDKLGDMISISYGEIFRKELDSLNDLSGNDKVRRLSTIISEIEDIHAKGKIYGHYYTKLKEETSMIYQEIFKKKIDSLNNLPEDNKEKVLIELKDDISEACSKVSKTLQCLQDPCSFMRL
jgi:hypothetical protein